MCLIVDNKVKLPELINEEYFIGYKVLLKDGAKSPLELYQYKQGWNEPSTKFRGYTDNGEKLGKGILHIFLTEQAARIFCSSYLDVIVKVHCYIKDLVAVGTMDGASCYPQAGMARIFISEEEYQKASSTTDDDMTTTT
jgi:hypothetical protein